MTKIKHTSFIACRCTWALIFLCLPWIAQASDYNQARAVVTKMTGTLLAELDKNLDLYKENDEELFSLVHSVVVPAVNVTAMSKVVLGKHAKAMSEKKKNDFQAAFQNMLIKSYSCLLYTSPSPRDRQKSRMPSSA